MNSWSRDRPKYESDGAQPRIEIKEVIKVFCTKCGSAANGRYCSNCGQRLRSRLEEYRLIEKRMRKEFIDSCSQIKDTCLFKTDLMHLAEACWLASTARYRRDIGYDIDIYVPDEVFDGLVVIQSHAKKL